MDKEIREDRMVHAPRLSVKRLAALNAENPAPQRQQFKAEIDLLVSGKGGHFRDELGMLPPGTPLRKDDVIVLFRSQLIKIVSTVEQLRGDSKEPIEYLLLLRKVDGDGRDPFYRIPHDELKNHPHLTRAAS